MKTLVVAATLAFAPVLLHAQATSPAQPQQLQARLVAPAAFSTASDAANVVHRTTTGVTEPKLVNTAEIVVSSSAWSEVGTHTDRKVTVAMIVDEKGVPCDLKIVESAGPSFDRSVLAAVAQYRYVPGTLDNAPTAVPVNLHLIVRHPNSL